MGISSSTAKTATGIPSWTSPNGYSDGL